MKSSYRLKESQKKELKEILSFVLHSNYQTPVELSNSVENLINNIDYEKNFSEYVDEIIRNIPISDDNFVHFKTKIHEFRASLEEENTFDTLALNIGIIKF
ncbi:hypothetical protein [Francisella sp. SYW-2]|uniref:hypothetical protein n=1 Tax=Francisella sp. SYW-2 TaxID=2610886 RepID=UPI00123DB067|nr:hypothetical protein [Francisella sp. SYW-2]